MQLLLYVYLMSIPDEAVGRFENMRNLPQPPPPSPPQPLDSNRGNVSAKICRGGGVIDPNSDGPA